MRSGLEVYSREAVHSGSMRGLRASSFKRRVALIATSGIVVAGGLFAVIGAPSPVNASLLDHLAAPMKVRQDRLGHADPRTTMGYTHVIGDDHRKVAEQLWGFFAQVRLNLPKKKNGSGEESSQAVEV